MKIYTRETISYTYDENKKLIDSRSREMYLLYPDEGKLIRNKLNGMTTDAYVGIGSKDDINNYEEIDKE